MSFFHKKCSFYGLHKFLHVWRDLEKVTKKELILRPPWQLVQIAWHPIMLPNLDERKLLQKQLTGEVTEPSFINLDGRVHYIYIYIYIYLYIQLWEKRRMIRASKQCRETSEGEGQAPNVKTEGCSGGSSGTLVCHYSAIS